MTSSLIQPLFDGPLDIVGDVHGEIDPLHSLMRHLGYDDDGEHPDGRRLVFVGDLTDRGPDSPAVVNLVRRLIGSGQAQCVLGNHDLNILLDHRKHDNGWFYGEEFTEDGKVVPQVLADEASRQQVLDFFRTLPIALERDDLRVVHACWNDEMIDIARNSSDVVALYNEHHELIEDSFPGLDLDHIDKGLEHQNKNPVKRLTSGPEERIEKPIEASGKTRNERRVRWWNDYKDTFCVFGHYSIFDGDPRGSGAAFCVDYGVGKRWTERRAGKSSGFDLKLAALRWPERVVVFDEGAKKSARLPSWDREGGVVIDVHSARQDWQLPSEATPLSSFHVTLIGRKVFLEQQDEMAKAWESVRPTLSLPPQAEFDTEVNQAVDEDRRTWFLQIVNQDAFRSYVEELTNILDVALNQHIGSGFTNPETDRYFHMSVANNRGGDPLESIGSIRPPMREPPNQKRKKIVHDFAKWTAQSALRSGSPLKAGKEIYGLIENHADVTSLFDSPREIDQNEFDRWHERTILAFCEIEPALKEQVGWAAKIVNVYLKTRVYLAGEGRVGLVSVIHPPIDEGLQKGLKKQFPNRPWKKKWIKDIRSYQDDYLPLIQDFRSIAEMEGCLPIELEYYWRGAER